MESSLTRAIRRTFPAQLVDQILYVEVPSSPSSHGDGIVVQNLVSDVRTRGDGGAYRQYAGMKIGAVAKVLEHMGVSVKVPGLSRWRLRRPFG